MEVRVKHSDIQREDSCKRGEELAKIILKQTPKTVAILELGGKLNDVLNEAYRLTNSIGSAWYKNKEISVSEEAINGCRSTSIGDIVEVCGVSYMVDSVGYICLDDIKTNK